MPPYIVYKGKIAEMSPEIGDWNARTSAQNSAVRAIGITGVNFRTPNWSSELASKGLKLIDKKEDADKLVKEYKDEQAAIAAEEKRQNELDAIASNIKRLGSGGQYDGAKTTTPAQREALNALSAKSNFGSTELSGQVNFQVSDDQIVNDYNNSRISTLRNIADRGNAQIAGITERLNSAQTLINQLPKGDSRRTSSEAYIKQLKSDLSSVQGAVVEADSKIKDFKPIKASSPEAAKQITSFREYLQLPEERASQQLRQIDPESYQTSVELGKKYREMATAPIGQTQNAQTEAFRAELEKGYRDYSKSPIGKTQDAQTEAYRAQLQKEIQGYSLGKIGATTSPEAEALRRQVEGETAAQLALGSRLGAEEQRQYQQYSRGAQAARGNIFGVAPAVEEAVTTGMAGEARRQARYGAASQFLSSGQTTSDALAKDVQLREALQQGRYQAGGAMLASGQTVSDAMARDVQLRNALQQSRLGAGGQFLTSGQTMSDALRGDIAFRDALQQNRMGAAANFVAGGPTIGNLSQARTAQQQNAFQNYIQANQSLPGGFNQQPSTAANFYQTTSPEIPVALTNAFNNLYSSLAGYQANTYGAQVGAISRQQSGAQQAASILGGISGFTGLFGGPGSNAFFRG